MTFVAPDLCLEKSLSCALSIIFSKQIIISGVKQHYFKLTSRMYTIGSYTLNRLRLLLSADESFKAT